MPPCRIGECGAGGVDQEREDGMYVDDDEALGERFATNEELEMRGRGREWHREVNWATTVNEVRSLFGMMWDMGNLMAVRKGGWVGSQKAVYGGLQVAEGWRQADG